MLWVVNFTTRQLYPWKKDRRYALSMSLVWPQSPSRLFEEENNLLPPLGFESRTFLMCSISMYRHKVRRKEQWYFVVSTIKLTQTDTLNIPHFVRTLKALAWRHGRAYKKEKGVCWFMSEINSIQRSAAASIFRRRYDYVAFLLSPVQVISSTRQVHDLGSLECNFPWTIFQSTRVLYRWEFTRPFSAPTSSSFPLAYPAAHQNQATRFFSLLICELNYWFPSH